MAVGGKLNGAVIRTVHLSECRQPEPSQPIRLTKTTLTFTGKKAGTTFVVIDGVKYIITVTEEQLQDVLLPINLWITNTGVVPTGWSDGTPSEFTYTDDAGNRRSTYTLKATYGGVYSENGIELSGILPSPDGKATSWDGKHTT